MRKPIAVVIAVLALCSTAAADDVCKVTLHSQTQADTLENSRALPLIGVRGGYLVLVSGPEAENLRRAGLDMEVLRSNVDGDDLYMDGRFDRKNTERFDVVFEEDGIRLLHIPSDQMARGTVPAEVFPVPERYLKIQYYPLQTEAVGTPEAPLSIDIAAIIAEIEQDSLEYWVTQLQSFQYRLAGTEASYQARDWIADKFFSWGYDPVIDPFIGSQLWDRIPVQCYNVIASKTGTRYPDEQVVIGGHFDAVPDCPGADDNASGTATVLEIARVIKDIETERTIILIAFDSEESWMYGSYHYCDEAVLRGDDILLMINPDMVADEDNYDRANLYYGAVNAYAVLWGQMASTYGLGLIGDLSGSTASDHLPFQEAGYDVIFVQEKTFSSNYHKPSDSTVYLNFEYMTRMVKTTAATLLSVSESPRAIRPLAVWQVGDGQSLMIHWEPSDRDDLAAYRVGYYGTNPATATQSIIVPASDTCLVVDGLTEFWEYAFYVQAVDANGNASAPNYRALTGAPLSAPISPENLIALPVHMGVRLIWTYTYRSLDFDHCAIVRDGSIVGTTTDTTYVDDDALGSEFHSYQVMAIDTEGDHSDTIGVEPAVMRAATLDPDRVIAINRTSCCRSMDLVNEEITGEFMREALSGYDFDYYSDSVAITNPTNPITLDLVDMIDYGVLVVAAETGRYDDIGVDPAINGILDTLAYYVSIGGRAVIFGRWGVTNDYDTINYATNPYNYDDAYRDCFHIGERVTTLTSAVLDTLKCDMIGATAVAANYSNLQWDSLATLSHSQDGSYVVHAVGGIPCVSYVNLTSDEPDVLYTYDSRGNDPEIEGKPVAWRYLGDDYQYIYFDIPLSFFERETAIDVLRRAVNDLTDYRSFVEENEEVESLPQSFVLHQNYPNPFNPITAIRFSLPERSHVQLSVYNVLGQRVVMLVDEELPAGTHNVEWKGVTDSGDQVATGIYLYQIKAGDYIESKKMILLK